MSSWTGRSGGLLAAAAALFVLAGGAGTANAQESLIDFLWGGEPEFGGKRQDVKFDTKYPVGQIIVSFGDRRLYHIIRTGVATSYPIAVPREQSRWEGNTTVTSKRENPDWTPTPDMLKENPKLPSWVPGGHPMNPLGVRAMYLGSSTYRIHGTDAPWTIGQAVSKGCIRMFNEDVLDLYPRVKIGTKVIVTWNNFNADGVIASAETPAASAASSSEPATNSSASVLQSSGKGTTVATTSKAPTGGSSGGPFTPPKTGFFIYPDDEANPPKPEEGMVTKYGRKVGGTVSRASQQTVSQAE
jgi:lipoprotein-anchoring transpeptidase ErfK/SrfK